MPKVDDTVVSQEFTRDQHEEYKISYTRVLLITTFVAFGGFLFGYDCIIGGQLVEIKKFAEDFGTQRVNGEMGFSAEMRGAFVSTMAVGTFLGALCAPLLCDRFGRKKGIIYTCVIFSVGIICQTAASHLALLMIGRFIAGFGVGLVSVMVPLYQSECVPGKRRGTIVSCYQLAITIGLLIGQIVTYSTSGKTTRDAYRIPIALQFVWSGVLGIGMFFFPETPRYLIRAGKWDEAVRAKVRLSGLPANHPHVQEELLEIKGNYEHEMQLGPATYSQCWQGNNLRRTLLGIFIQVWQQRIFHQPDAQLILLVTGVNFIFYFGSMFFRGAGIDNPFKVAMIMGTVNCCCTIPGMYLVERMGRRKLLLYGATVQVISHLLVGIIHVATDGKQPIWTAIFSGTFIAAFAASWGPCAWILTSELFGLKTRAKQMSFATAGNWYPSLKG